MKNKLRILIVGQGGREHSIAYACAQSPRASSIVMNPGNGGTVSFTETMTTRYSEFDAWKDEVLRREIDLIIIGPEQPLVDGLVDQISADEDLSSIAVVGPSQRAAMLEGSKAFAKAFMEKYHIPTARYGEFDDEDEAFRFLEQMDAPYVLKADGLAAGKGVLIIEDLEEAKACLQELLAGKFGEASKKVIIEDFLSGREFSVFAMMDSSGYMLLPIAKDYKRIGEGDTGLNTGGMGSVSPVPFVDADMLDRVVERIVEPTYHGILEEGLDYRGFLFFGLIDVGGHPYVIEYNCRLGDPETQSILPRLTSDFVEHCLAIAHDQIDQEKVRFTEKHAATVMTTSGGYPENYQKGMTIKLPTSVSKNSMIFHSGTVYHEGKLLTDGGRVMAATVLGSALPEVLKGAKDLAEGISFDGKYFRRDIGADLL